MSHSSREDLLGYLLGALERPDHERVEQELSQNPQLLDDLTRLKRCLEHVGLSEEPEFFAPPVGLAERTCLLVANHQQAKVFPARRGLTPSLAGEYRRGFSFSDFTALAAVVVAAAALFFPALSNSRFQANLGACQNQLRQIGMALQEYSTLQPDHRFPQAELVGNRNVAGIMAPILVDHQLVRDSRMFVCPSSSLAQNIDRFRTPTLPEIDRAQGKRLAELQHMMGGSYGYSLGYQENGELQPVQDERRPNFALVSDAPSDEVPCRTSINHGRIGQNMLYEDGHTTFVRGSCKSLRDDPFHNLKGEVAAGLHRDDAVLGESSAHPLPVQLIEHR